VHCVVAWQERFEAEFDNSFANAFGDSFRVCARRWIRALEMPPASHRKMASEAAVDGTC
jgi:hypothetical protein